jgi:hypothetical protein
VEERKQSERDIRSSEEAHADMFNHVRPNEVSSKHHIVSSSSSSPRHKYSATEERQSVEERQSDAIVAEKLSEVSAVEDVVEEQQSEVHRDNLVLTLPEAVPIVTHISTALFDEMYSPVRPQFTPRRTRTHSGELRPSVDRSSSPASPVARAHQPPKMFSPLLLSGSYDDMLNELNKVCDDAVTQLSVGKPTAAATPSRDSSTISSVDRLTNLIATPTALTFSPKTRTPVMRTIRSFPQSMLVEPPTSDAVAIKPSTSPSSAQRRTPRSSAPTPRPESQDEAELWYAARRERSQLSALVSRLQISPGDIAPVAKEEEEKESVEEEVSPMETQQQQEEEGTETVVGDEVGVKSVDAVGKVQSLVPPVPVIVSEISIPPLADDTPEVSAPTVSAQQPVDEQPVSTLSAQTQFADDTTVPHPSLSPLFAVKLKRKAPPTPKQLATTSPMDASRLAHSDSVVKSSRSASQRRRNSRSVEEARLELLSSFSRERLVVMIVQLQDEVRSQSFDLVVLSYLTVLCSVGESWRGPGGQGGGGDSPQDVHTRDVIII